MFSFYDFLICCIYVYLYLYLNLEGYKFISVNNTIKYYPH